MSKYGTFTTGCSQLCVVHCRFPDTVLAQVDARGLFVDLFCKRTNRGGAAELTVGAVARGLSQYPTDVSTCCELVVYPFRFARNHVLSVVVGIPMQLYTRWA